MVELEDTLPNDQRCADGCPTIAQGTSNLSFQALVGHDLSHDVVAGIDSDGAIVLTFGACCDRGELGMRGVLSHDTISGRWQESYVSGGQRGTVMLMRQH
jgi:hypothetical protein